MEEQLIFPFSSIVNERKEKVDTSLLSHRQTERLDLSFTGMSFIFRCLSLFSHTRTHNHRLCSIRRRVVQLLLVMPVCVSGKQGGDEEANCHFDSLSF